MQFQIIYYLFTAYLSYYYSLLFNLSVHVSF